MTLFIRSLAVSTLIATAKGLPFHSVLRELHDNTAEGKSMMTDPPAKVLSADELTEASTFGICDDFEGEGFADNWADEEFNTLTVVDGKLERDSNMMGWQHAAYTPVSYLPENPTARISVRNFNPMLAEGTMGVALTLGVGGEDTAPAFVLVSDFANNQVYLVCSYENGSSAWGNVVISLEGDRNALGSSFTMQASMDSITGEAGATVSDIVEGPLAGATVSFPCGNFPRYDVVTLGEQAGVGIFGSDAAVTVAVEDFSHSGCIDEPEELPEEVCNTCPGRFFAEGVAMRRFVRERCIFVCVPALLQSLAERLNAECGECEEPLFGFGGSAIDVADNGN